MDLPSLLNDNWYFVPHFVLVELLKRLSVVSVVSDQLETKTIPNFKN